MKKILSFDIDQTLNVAKTPIPDEIADLLISCLRADFAICPISGQKFDQFLIQIVNRLVERGATPVDLTNLHLFVAQGTQYYKYETPGKKLGPVELSVTKPTDKYDEKNWKQVYSYPLTDDQVKKIATALETAAKELGFWEEDKLQKGDTIIENRLSQVTFSALGQNAGTKEKYAWDPDCKKREKIVKRAKELAPEFDYEIGVLSFGDMTQPGGNDYPVKEMGIDTITVRSHEDTAFALRGILGVTNNL